MAERLKRFIEELQRRKVIATAGMYLVGSFVTMQVVDAVFQYLPFKDPGHAGTLVLIILAVGFPIALGVSWFLEITPPQLRREVPRESFVAERTAPPAAVEVRPDSLAVLPFDNLSDDPENQYFSDGITDDIITSVARIQGLRVLSRASVMQYRGVQRRVGQIAAELGVATVVSGSVRRSGTRIRVVAEVVDAGTDEALWRETYDRELEDIFEVQSDVAASIATAVQRELTAADRKRITELGTTDVEAYDAYLRARHLWNQRTEASVESSLRGFERAIERDPGFGLAHSSLAEAYTVLGVYGARAPEEVFPRARAAAERALALDPELGEAVAAEACVAAVYEWDWEAAEAGFRRALGLSPSYATAHQWFAVNVLAPQGRFAEAFESLENACELDPGSSAIASSRGVVGFYDRAYDAAGREFQQVIELHPAFALGHYFLGQCQVLRGEVEAGLASLAHAVELSDESSESVAAYAHALGTAGRREEATALLSQLRERSARRYVSPALIAQVLVGLGEHPAAIAALRDAIDARASDLIWLAVRPQYDPIRNEPGFAALLERVHLDDCGALESRSA